MFVHIGLLKTCLRICFVMELDYGLGQDAWGRWQGAQVVELSWGTDEEVLVHGVWSGTPRESGDTPDPRVARATPATEEAVGSRAV